MFSLQAANQQVGHGYRGLVIKPLMVVQAQLTSAIELTRPDIITHQSVMLRKNNKKYVNISDSLHTHSGKLHMM